MHLEYASGYDITQITFILLSYLHYSCTTSFITSSAKRSYYNAINWS